MRVDKIKEPTFKYIYMILNAKANLDRMEEVEKEWKKANS
jgi:hypothetical protein